MSTQRLSSKTVVPDNVGVPDYNPESHGVGIVHIGIGAFHRAHQAAYTDDALAVDGGNWRITGVSLRGTDVADALTPQDAAILCWNAAMVAQRPVSSGALQV